MSKTFREWNVEQHWLLPPSVMDFVPADHIAHFIRDTVREQLDLSEVLAPYEKEERGYPPYNPVMMTALLLYAYCQGVYSSRRIARGCEERMDFMAVTGLNRPDFRTVSDFRKRHLDALQGLFVQVLTLCQHAGLVKLGHVSLDGTKVKACLLYTSRIFVIRCCLSATQPGISSPRRVPPCSRSSASSADFAWRNHSRTSCFKRFSVSRMRS